jgi:translation initiation factor IF-2
VEEALAARHGKKSGRATAAPEPPKHQPKTIPTHTSSFSDLLSQIEQEKERIDEAKKQAAEAKRAPKKQPKRARSFEPDVPELEQGAEASSEDRYAQMAVQAEKLQRDKVLAEARAAVAAASSHEGEGRRKKRKEI